VSFLIAITPFRQNLRAQDSLRKYRANLIVFLEISLKSVPLVRKPPDPGNNTTMLYFLDAPASISDTSHLIYYLV